MLRETIEILTSHTSPVEKVVMGNVAIARGAIEAGVSGVFSYPGTPSTEISEVFNYVHTFQHNEANQEHHAELTEHKIYFEYSINEKIALEKAIAFTIGHEPALCVMKNVGMNVASDALMSIAYQTIMAPLVIVVCDDPGCHSSSNEQDSRFWGPMASVPVFNPASPLEALKMTKDAFRLSAALQLPVIVRTTTRVSHSRGVVPYGMINRRNIVPGFDRVPEHINIPARTAAAHLRLVEKLSREPVPELWLQHTKCHLTNDRKMAIISSGVSIQYIDEVLCKHALDQQISRLHIGLIHPFPEREIINFLNKGFEKILIIEELEPFIENAVRIIAQKNKITSEIIGKGFSLLSVAGELTVDSVTTILSAYIGTPLIEDTRRPLDGFESLVKTVPPRPPVLCAGCPHRATFYLLKLAIPREESELILCGDIGCFGLGALPPLKMIDTINHMGMSVSMAQGLNEAFRTAGHDKKLVAMTGDGTFFHSGLSSLVNAVYTRANLLLVIFDNRTIGMTGHQSHPGASRRLPKYHEIDIPPLLKGLGIEVVETINPYHISESYAALNRAMEHQGVSVIISKSACIFLPDFHEKRAKGMRIVVDPTGCNSCANHEDLSLACSRCYAPKNNLQRAKAKLLAEVQIPGEEQLCPANICNHGFFNSIREGDHKSAVEIVRDKMLFARTCGDICHRPCELFSTTAEVVPIKALKKYVSSFDEYFSDFAGPLLRTKSATKKNSRVAIVGAGPAGLSAGYDLVQAGYEVEIYERESAAGGMVAHVIPGFRMDKSGFLYEAMQLETMGVKFHFNKSLGKEIALDTLTATFDAVILAMGMNNAKKLDVIEKNIPDEKRTDALSFLKSYNRGENILADGTAVLVIGGGNSAMDAARAAKRAGKGIHVTVSCIEKESDMPAFHEEVLHAKEEGIGFICDTFVDDIRVSEKLQIRLSRFESKLPECTMDFDFVITSIGQQSEVAGMGDEVMDESGRVDAEVLGNKLFVAGDLRSGNNMSVIGAIASGKKAAVEVRKALEHYPYLYEGEFALNRLNETTSWASVHQRNITAEAAADEVMKYNLFQSCMKCNHCIDNFGCPAMIKVNGKVQIDESRCTLCGLCIDVCPNNAIRWEVVEVSVEKIT